MENWAQPARGGAPYGVLLVDEPGRSLGGNVQFVLGDPAFHLGCGVSAHAGGRLLPASFGRRPGEEDGLQDRERNNWQISAPLTLPSPQRGEGTADSYSFRGP